MLSLLSTLEEGDDDDSQTLKLTVMIGKFRFPCLSLENEKIVVFQFICTSKNFLTMELKKLLKFTKVLVLVAVEAFQKHVDKFLEEFILVDIFWKRNRGFIPFSSRKTFKVCLNVFLFMVCFQVLPPFCYLALFTVEDVQKLDVKLLEVFIPKECSRKREVIPKLKHAAMHGKRRYEMDLPRHEDSFTVFIHAPLDDGNHEKSILFEGFLVTNEGPSREERALETIQGVLHHVVAISSLASGYYACKNSTCDEDDMLSPSAGYDLHGYYSVVHACMSKGPMVHAARMSFSNHDTQRMVQGKAGLLPYKSRHFKIGVERSFCLLPHMVHLFPDYDLFVDYPPDINTFLFSRQGNVASLFSFAADFKGKRFLHATLLSEYGYFKNLGPLDIVLQPSRFSQGPMVHDSISWSSLPCLHVPLSQGQKSSFPADDNDKVGHCSWKETLLQKLTFPLKQGYGTPLFRLSAESDKIWLKCQLLQWIIQRPLVIAHGRRHFAPCLF